MLKKNMIHFMASDIHTENQTSYDRASHAFKTVEGRFKELYLLVPVPYMI